MGYGIKAVIQKYCVLHFRLRSNMSSFFVKCRNSNLLPLLWSLCPLLSSLQNWKKKKEIICKWTGAKPLYATTGIMAYLMSHIGMYTHNANNVEYLFSSLADVLFRSIDSARYRHMLMLFCNHRIKT